MQRIELFGGALVTILPSHWRDFSLDRPIQDNQEIFVDQPSGSVFVVDIVETPSTTTLETMCEFHLNDLAECNGIDDMKHTSFTKEVKYPRCSDPQTQFQIIEGIGSMEDHNVTTDKHFRKILKTYLCVGRLGSSNTDILIYITDATQNHDMHPIFVQILSNLVIDTAQLGI
ncbi:hypothetical protein GEMRC1_012759 [Eukaryota sp. GEM-RC1]